MGTPIAATVVYDDGATQHFDDVQAALRQAADGRVELHYAYSADALPPSITERFDMWRYRRLLPLARDIVTYLLMVGGAP